MLSGGVLGRASLSLYDGDVLMVMEIGRTLGVILTEPRSRIPYAL